MLLLVGLGNPGPEYRRNRHNVGFMAVDEIVRRHGFSPYRKRFQGQVSEGQIGTQKVLVLKPDTYMNLSGNAVGEAVRFYKIDPADVVVFQDEVDLVPGKLRVKRGGGAAGHNGLRSIDATIGPEYRRVRIGVGHPGSPELVHRWVLQDFVQSDKGWLEPLVLAMAEHAALLAAGDDAGFMNKVALAINPPAPKEPKPGPAAQEKI